MRGWRILIITLCLVLIIPLAAACGSSQPQMQQVRVTTGDLTISVNSNGKIEADTESRPSFGNGGKIEKLNIEEGDEVTRGMVLAQLETDHLELALSQARTAEAQARLGLTQSRSALSQTEAALAQAQFNLDRTEAVSKIKDEITKAQWDIQMAEMLSREANAVGDSESAKYWRQKIPEYEGELAKKQKKLADLLAEEEYTGAVTYNIMGQKYDRLTVQDVRMKQLQVEIAQQAIEQAEQTIEQAERSLEQAQKAVTVAQKQLDDATIVAPFDGLIASVDIKKGDIIGTPGSSSVAPVYMVNVNSLEVSVEIDEIDVAGIQLNQKAVIRLDAYPGARFEGKVTDISLLPVANPRNSGIVLYEVKASFAGNIPDDIKPGMTAVVDIITEERKDVILVPNKSIGRNNQGQAIVRIKNEQDIEERVVVKGLTDGIQTEILSGLDEGDVVL